MGLLIPKNTGPALAPTESVDSTTKQRSVTLRAILLGLLLIPLNAYWVVQMERVRYSAHPTTVSLFFNCIFILVVLAGMNSLVARWGRKGWAFKQGELMLVYSMLCIGSCMAGHDMGQMLVPSLTWPFAQSTPSNNYDALFGRYLPKWAMASDTDATKAYYLGNSTLYTSQHLHAWIGPALIWTVFVVVLLFTMQCINVLIRKQWTENEKLTYPLARIPLQITDHQPGGRGGGLPLFKNRLFWIGFALAASVDTINSLNYYYPAIHPIFTPGNGQSSIDLQQYFNGKPWNAIGWTPASFYPFLVGIGMLMPMDFLFSSWFFYLVWKLETIVTVAAAWDADARMPYANYQAFGAYFLFLASTLWLSRTYFKRVVRCALGQPTDIDDHDEPMRYRGAFLGLAFGLALLMAFSMALGLSWWLSGAFFLIYLALALAITRMRAELGTPVHDLHFTGPDWALTDLLGPRVIGASGLAVFSLFFWFNRAYRAHPMPHQLEGFYLADQTSSRTEMGREMRGWFWVLLLAGGVGMLAAFWAMLHCGYHYGALGKQSGTFGPEAWDRYGSWLKQPKPANGHVALAIAVGFLFAAFLQTMRVRFAWWPLHPLAYAVSGSWEMNLVWMPLMIAWLLKSLLLRYGGMKVYLASLPFFYGLILGQFIPGSLLNIWGIITGTPTYQFWQ